ncbi:formate transporter FocA [Vibrio sp. SCSIO 43137]|uniref:formate transporter FocA n=1 Tax=Vibrio sp. SCSIO 43137 TaxID=3021011 RepID=UPI002308084C|nr:formate transporter FocA [Vibrio sp. SCSIO 43137]WCE31334.1 formate transporter FocA [Vibrio sp. SCSIO 43137]
MFSPSEMMEQAEKFAVKKATKSPGTVLSLAVMAGIFIGLAFLFYITATTGSSGSWGANRVLGGLAFSMGLILIVLCGAELFTSSVLTSISWANKEISFSAMVKRWALVYAGNFVGALLLLTLVTLAGLYQLDNGQWGLNALLIAQHKLHHTPVQAVSLGILCNLLVCLAIWLTFSSSNALTKAFLVMLPVAMFVSSGFEHCVANMFMVPLGIVIQSTAPDAFWAQIGSTPAQFSDLSVSHFISANLVPVTIGNIIGGAILVGLTNWFIYRKPTLKITQISQISSQQLTSSVKELTMNTHLNAQQIMNANPVTLTADMPVEAAIDTLTQHKIDGAPVVTQFGQLIGFFSVHNVMVDLWCNDYLPPATQLVGELMSRDVTAINSEESLVNIVEFMSIDKDQIYPTTSMGIATQLTSLSLEERAKNARVTRPNILPVIRNEQLVGVVSRQEVIGALRSIYGESSYQQQSETELATA